jgi:protein TonB
MSLRPDQRRVVIAGSVVLVHVLLLWAMQSGLMRRAVETLIPGEILTAIISQPAPTAAPQPQTPRATATPKAAQQMAEKTPTPPTPSPEPTPQPIAIPASASAPAIDASTVAVTAAAPAAPARYEEPSSSAAYLNNAKPNYPTLSRRLGEQGKVIVSVLIGIDGTAHSAQIKRSSGYDRLDQAALATVRSWRYAPAKRNGVPEATTWDIPINFVLE